MKKRSDRLVNGRLVGAHLSIASGDSGFRWTLRGRDAKCPANRAGPWHPTESHSSLRNFKCAKRKQEEKNIVPRLLSRSVSAGEQRYVNVTSPRNVVPSRCNATISIAAVANRGWGDRAFHRLWAGFFRFFLTFLATRSLNSFVNKSNKSRSIDDERASRKFPSKCQITF